MSEHLKICSFNCEGVSRSTEYMNEFLSKYECDLLCLQETWLLNENLSKLGNIHDKYLYTGKSGVDSTRDILIGRPAGGVSILYHKSIAKYIECIDIAHPRLCSVILRSVSDMSILVISVYMPCDNYSMTNVNTEFEEVISIIECTMHTHDCDAYILCGDFNTCFIRANAQSKCLNEFNERNNLLNAWESPISHRGYTYTNYSLNHNSCIDYFFVTENVFDQLKECVVHYDPTNPSNHNVISLDYRCDSRNNVIRDRSCKSAAPRNAWYKATDDDIKMYQSRLDDLLDIFVFRKTLSYVVMCYANMSTIYMQSISYVMISLKVVSKLDMTASHLKSRIIIPYLDGKTKLNLNVIFQCFGIGCG